MTKLPSLTGQQLISALRKAGFEVICVKDSHHFIRRPDGRCTVVRRTVVKPSAPGFCPRSCGIAT